MDFRVLLQRPDLLADEAHIVATRRVTWGGRLAQIGDYGTSGGSAADRRSIIETMAALEAEHRPYVRERATGPGRRVPTKTGESQ